MVFYSKAVYGILNMNNLENEYIKLKLHNCKTKCLNKKKEQCVNF